RRAPDRVRGRAPAAAASKSGSYLTAGAACAPAFHRRAFASTARRAWWLAPPELGGITSDPWSSGRSMERTCAVLLTLAASCYSPRLNEGTPCASTADCPFPQRCVLGSCAQRVPAIDAALPVDAAESEDAAAAAIDAAAVDAAPDAMPLPCMTSGL